jgi:hypothetical protein
MDLFQLVGKIVIENAAANKSIDDTSDRAKKSASDVKALGDEGSKTESKLKSAMSKATGHFDGLKNVITKISAPLSKLKSGADKVHEGFNKLGTASVKAMKLVGTGLIAGSTAVGKLGKAAIDAYGDYEQLVGGVETLFGAGGKSLDEYAKSIGKSTNAAKAEYNKLQSAQTTVLNNAAKAYKTAGMSQNEYMTTVTGFSASLIQSLGGDTEKAAKKADQAVIQMSDNANKMGTDLGSIQTAYQGFAKQNYTMLDNLKLGYGGTKEEMQRLLSDATKLSGVKYDVSSYADIVDAIKVVQDNMGITGTTAKEASTTIQGSISSAKASWQNLLVGLSDDTQDFDSLLGQFIDSAMTVADNLLPRISIIADKIPVLVTGIVNKLPGLLNSLLPPLIQAAVALVQGLITALPQILTALIAILPMLINGLGQIITALVSVLPQLINQIVAFLSDPSNVQLLIEGAVTLFTAIPLAISQCLPTIIQQAPQIIYGIISGLVRALPTLLSSFKQILTNMLDAFLSFFGIHSPSTVMAEKSRNIVLGIINGIKTLPQEAGEWFRRMRDKTVEIIDKMKSDVAMKFAQIKTKITQPIEDAKGFVATGLNSIRGFFTGLHLHLPHIDLPHFKISGSLSIKPPSVPHLDIDWYSKAMDNPMLLNSSTIFGYNPATGNFMAGGEAGQEVVAGAGTLMGMIQAAISNENATLTYYLNKIVALLGEYFPQMLLAANGSLVADDNAILAHFVPKIDRQLGDRYRFKERGNI